MNTDFRLLNAQFGISDTVTHSNVVSIQYLDVSIQYSTQEQRKNMSMLKKGEVHF